MVVSYSQDASLVEALEKTFDGKHPCNLCRNIDESKRSEKKSDSQLDMKKFEFSFVASEFVFSAPALLDEPESAINLIAAPVQSPPVPPPRQVFA